MSIDLVLVAVFLAQIGAVAGSWTGRNVFTGLFGGAVSFALVLGFGCTL